MTTQNDENDLLQLEERRAAAMNAADPEALLALLHDDHVHVMANGMVTDKQGAAASLRSTLMCRPISGSSTVTFIGGTTPTKASSGQVTDAIGNTPD